MERERIFGTDGIRGRAGEGWLAAGTVSALGRAAGRVLGPSVGDSQRTVVLGHDGRRSGPELAEALARGLSQCGFEIQAAGLITTPGLAWLVREREFALGAMISASHNPPEDNGIKLFARGGGKLSDALELEIENELLARPDPVEPEPDASPACPPLDPSLEEDYLNHLVESGGAGLDLSGLTLVLDCANGGASRVGPRVFGRLGARVQALAAEPDGENINHECGSTSPAAVQSAVRSSGADLGIALDGDGDRCILVDAAGGIVDGDGILTLVARHAAQRGELADGRIVATVMSNRGLHRALREVGVGVLTCPVGDRNVVLELQRHGLSVGGEQSGHIVFGPDNHHIGDGLYTALRVLRVVQQSGRPLAELAAAYQPLPQVLLNVPVARKPPIEGLPGLKDRIAAIESDLGQDGRVLLRYSGTEDLARVMVEGPEPALIRRYAQDLAEFVRGAIGSSLA